MQNTFDLPEDKDGAKAQLTPASVPFSSKECTLATAGTAQNIQLLRPTSFLEIQSEGGSVKVKYGKDAGVNEDAWHDKVLAGDVRQQPLTDDLSKVSWISIVSDTDNVKVTVVQR